ncbi:hypothetical protein BGC07_00210 [Piscirickettsia litoralis]|uniref:Transposase n=1 Tax=Piscirickettsia litoralis TaxID=1891921 RepID=A0ABX3A203_9GAMM|nr:hypothetical protein BGC07_00210 [Piscirickettsia litoralis]
MAKNKILRDAQFYQLTDRGKVAPIFLFWSKPIKRNISMPLEDFIIAVCYLIADIDNQLPDITQFRSCEFTLVQGARSY